MSLAFRTSWIFLYRRRALHIERVLVPTVVASAAGIVVGALLLVWLVGTAYQILRLLLGRASWPAPCCCDGPQSAAVDVVSRSVCPGIASAHRGAIGQFSLLSPQLAAEALPVVLVVTSYAARRMPPGTGLGAADRHGLKHEHRCIPRHALGNK
jgi:hypothetical protein